jgi:hypothetical protein
MNYTTLCASIQDYVENSFSADQLATFVQQAEQRIYNSVQLPDLRKNVTGVMTLGNKYLSCPNDFLAPYSMAVVDGSGNYAYLLNKDVNYIREAYPNASDTAIPKYYAIFGPRSDDAKELSFILGPTPDDDYTVELHYFYYPESIVTAGQTWLGDNFDSALLWGSIVEAYVFLKGEADLIATYQKRYDDAMALLMNLGNGKDRGDAYRNGQYRVPAR